MMQILNDEQIDGLAQQFSIDCELAHADLVAAFPPGTSRREFSAVYRLRFKGIREALRTTLQQQGVSAAQVEAEFNRVVARSGKLTPNV